MVYYILTIGVRPLPDVTQHMTSVRLLRLVRTETRFRTTWLIAS